MLNATKCFNLNRLGQLLLTASSRNLNAIMLNIVVFNTNSRWDITMNAATRLVKERQVSEVNVRG